MYQPTEKTIENVKDLVKTFNRRIGQAKRKTPIQYQQYLPEKMTVEQFLSTVTSYKDIRAQARVLMGKDIIPEFGKQGAKPTKLQEARYESVKEQENKRIKEVKPVERYEQGKATGIERVKKRSKQYEIKKEASEFTPLELEIRIRQLERRQTKDYEEQRKKQWHENYERALRHGMPMIADKVLEYGQKIGFDKFMKWVEQEDYLTIDFIYDDVKEPEEKSYSYLENLENRMIAEGIKFEE